MLSANNLLAPKDGKPITVPSQDMILGSYYLTLVKDGEPGEGKVFGSMDEIYMALNEKVITLHSKVRLRVSKEVRGKMRTGIIDITPGRAIFNEAIPQDLGFVDRSKKGNELSLEITEVVGDKQLQEIIERCIKKHGMVRTAEVLDMMKDMGFKYSTKGAITISISDMEIPKEKKLLIEETEKQVNMVTKQYRRGLITDEERYNSVVKLWTETGDNVTDALMNGLSEDNPLSIMSTSGARGNKNQIKQLAGMIGLMFDTSGKTIEIPIKSNFREGLNVLEFFISSNGARKGLADTALRTADSGYLTRRLVDVSQEVIIKEEDCHTDEDISVKAVKDGGEIIEDLYERIVGRYVINEIVHPKTNKVIVEKDSFIDDALAKKVVDAGITKV
ncbi:MAG TPA: DNA-directed RNA polymerase subunit beta', partial [Clostridia bacterium]|nr:DNA-directed RNA polymerase subunit beta' [Clostridia bacterium]